MTSLLNIHDIQALLGATAVKPSGHLQVPSTHKERPLHAGEHVVAGAKKERGRKVKKSAQSERICECTVQV